ncbi:hypothetical protein ACIQAS_08410 [Bacillus safensis]|uniref:hypothetical protein n=1 Tax=Bacillus safensis TaxID=561879 RepID=UPI003811F1E0
MSNRENMAFNMGDLLFQMFSLLFIAFIVTINCHRVSHDQKKTNGIEKNRGKIKQSN